jgi:hypothetical protein
VQQGAAKALGVTDVAFHKKRGLAVEDMVKSRWVYRKLRNFRAGIEAGISYLKRASTPDGIWLGTYQNGPGRLFRFTAATVARLSDGETLGVSQAASMLTIPDHAQGAAIGGGGYGSRAAIGAGARSTGSTLRLARRSAAMTSRLVPRALPSAVPGNCGQCHRLSEADVAKLLQSRANWLSCRMLHCCSVDLVVLKVRLLPVVTGSQTTLQIRVVPLPDLILEVQFVD